MTDKDLELKKELERVDWPIDYGSVKIQIRNGKPTLITIERTVRWDDSDMPTLFPKPKITTRAPTTIGQYR